jgi:hypothetical protein
MEFEEGEGEVVMGAKKLSKNKKRNKQKKNNKKQKQKK